MKTPAGPKSKSTSPPTLPTNPAPLTVPTVTRQTLDGVPARALKLLRGMGNNLTLRAALEQRGFTDADCQEGWKLLMRTGAYKKAPGLAAVRYDGGVQKAVDALDAWDEDGFTIIRSTLDYRFPEQAAKVLDGLSASRGIEAVLGVATLLDRLDALGRSHDKKDKEAMAMLAKRGITPDVRKQLRTLVETAQSGGTVAAAPIPPAEEAAAADADHVAALMNLRGWYEEWAGVTKVAVKRRDQLIKVGMAKPKRSAYHRCTRAWFLRSSLRPMPAKLVLSRASCAVSLAAERSAPSK